MIQVVVDGPSVNLNFYNALANEISDSGIPEQLRAKQSKCQSCENVKVTVSDNLTIAKLEVFAYITSILVSFLKSYQSDMSPFLYLIWNHYYLQAFHWAKYNYCSQNEFFSNKNWTSNQIPNKDFDLGFVAEWKLK